MNGDARQHAADLIERLKLTQLKDSFCCYGTEDKVLIGIGRTSSLKLNDTGSLDDVWACINSYIEENNKNHIFGFIGFDPANQLGKQVED